MAIPYKLYYWPLPFRGCFIQLLLEHAGMKYDLANVDETAELKNLPVPDQPVPAMAPPYLEDRSSGEHLSQMPAIMMYLAGKHDYLPLDSYRRTLVLKILLDCNDVLSDLTNANGASMWEQEKWRLFRSERLPRWMQIFEQTGVRYGLENESGYLLGNDRVTCADIAATALFGTMMRCLEPLARDITRTAPRIAALVARIESQPRIKDFISRQQTEFGDLYCGGQIERSIRQMLAMDEADR
ncbi:MAG: glutathione S-transferase family protein [Gammaproteobacteria bacterium]|jgi:glutathione S-transferase